jgi:hypothetical protein
MFEVGWGKPKANCKYSFSKMKGTFPVNELGGPANPLVVTYKGGFRLFPNSPHSCGRKDGVFSATFTFASEGFPVYSHLR